MPEYAISHYQNKGHRKPAVSWVDMIGELNDAGITVAGMIDNDQLAYVYKLVGLSFFDNGFTPGLASKKT